MKTRCRVGSTSDNKNFEVLAILISGILFGFSASAEAQQFAKIPRVGWLALRPPSRIATSPSGLDLFWREFHALGYIPDKNVILEYRSAANKLDQLPVLADELVRLKVDVIIAAAISEANAAKQATKTIPIVFISSSDAVESGLVGSLAKPGGNLTGFITVNALLAGKRLELLKETVPTLSRVAVLRDPQSPPDQWKQNELAAKALQLQVYSMEVGSADKFESAFKEAIKAGSAGLTVTTSGFLNSNLHRTIELAAKYKLPAIYTRGDFTASGGLMSYGTDESEPYKRLAVMVDKILKGTKPAEIPVEKPTKFEFVINLNAARQIGLTIPPNVLARADRVIR
jgi:ABC-type uncharacterized transport system substrate-binding protein